MKKPIPKIIAGVMIAAVSAMLIITAAAVTISDATTFAVRISDGAAFEEQLAKLPPYELEHIAEMEADGFTLTTIIGHTDKQTGLYFIDTTFVKDNT